MDRTAALWLLTVLQLCFVGVLSSTGCCNGRNTEVESVGCSTKDCNTNCDCSAENCESCQGYERCCQSCCNTNCDCRSVSCNSCSSQSNECCSSCCNTKCRTSSCSTRQCRSCNCDSCSTRTVQNSACCNSCCKEQVEKQEVIPSSSNVSQITTLPNITIIINHAPIYVNNTPVITNEQRCGNASVLTNGTHIVYVYPQNSTCNNRTCCSRMVRPRCQPPVPPMPHVCPPPVYVSDCSPRCMYAPQPPQPMPMPVPMPMPMPMPIPQPQPCQYFQSWPYVHCPQTGCYGYSCAPPMPMSMPMPQPPPIYSGCIPLQTWPFIRCIPGMGGDSIVNYGSPSYQVQAPGAEGPAMPFSSGDHPAYPPSMVMGVPGAGMPN